MALTASPDLPQGALGKNLRFFTICPEDCQVAGDDQELGAIVVPFPFRLLRFDYSMWVDASDLPNLEVLVDATSVTTAGNVTKGSQQTGSVAITHPLREHAEGSRVIVIADTDAPLPQVSRQSYTFAIQPVHGV